MADKNDKLADPLNIEIAERVERLRKASGYSI